MKFTSYWKNLSKRFGDSWLTGYPDVLILARVINIYVLGTSCCECGYARVNRAQSAARVGLKIPTVSNVMTTQLLGPEIKDFDPAPIHEQWTNSPAENARGREMKALMRKINDAGVRGEIPP